MPTFNADLIIEMALNAAGNRSGDALLEAAAENELNLIIYEAEEDPSPLWFLQSEWATIGTTVDESRVPLPSDFLLEDNDSHLYLITAAGVKSQLVKDDADSLENKYLNVASSQPKYYAISGENYLLYPTPDVDTYTLQMRYYQSATALTPTVRTNQWTVNAADYLIAMLGSKLIAAYLGENTPQRQRLEADSARAMRRLRAKHIARQVANKELEMGD